MSDEDLIVRARQPSHKVPSAITISIIALVLSLGSAIFTGLQWWEARQARTAARLARGPYLEIEHAEFVDPSSLMMTVRNIGRLPALKPTSDNDAYFGGVFVQASEFRKAATIAKPTSVSPDIPVGKEAQIGAYVPVENIFKMYNTTYNDKTMLLELRGRISYKDDDGNVYDRSYCYTVHSPWGPGLPVAGTCVHRDDLPSNFAR